jgi:hypothetical protein
MQKASSVVILGICDPSEGLHDQKWFVIFGLGISGLKLVCKLIEV